MKNYNYIKYLLVVLVICVAGIFYYRSSMWEDNNTGTELFADEGSTGTVEEPGTGKDTQTEIESTFSEKSEIVVQVCGCVAKPGVFTISEGSRVYQVVELAGGVTPEADVTAVNQAETVSDGSQIYIPAVGEETCRQETEISAGQESGAKVNINNADARQLMTLPGIGQSKADAIIRYREDNGKYMVIEDVMNVSGIKQAAFDKIKDLICV